MFWLTANVQTPSAGGDARATMRDGRPRPSVSGPAKVFVDQRGAEGPDALQVPIKTSLAVLGFAIKILLLAEHVFADR
jgi:hypothetical protein